jgi:hypothetical protein
VGVRGTTFPQVRPARVGRVRAFSIAAVLATAAQAVTLIVLLVLPTGYDPVRDAVSDYGVGPDRGWFRLQAVADGGAT